MHLLYRLVNVINMVSVCGYLFLSKAFRNPNFMATQCINLENIFINKKEIADASLKFASA